MNNKCLSANIYKIYVLCLPFGRLFDFPFGDLFNKVITEFSTLVMLVGCLMLTMNNKQLVNGRNKLFLWIYTFMTISSLIMAIVLSFFLENQYESPFSAIAGDIVEYFLVILSIFYNCYCLTHYVTFPTLYKIFDWQIVILLFVGYAQFMGMLGFSTPYNILTSIFSLRELSWINDLDRGVTFFCSEPSHAGILCFIVIPYIFSCIKLKKGFNRFKYITALSLFTFLVICSKSSQFIILFIGSTLLYMWSCFKPINRLLYYCSFIVGLIFAIGYIKAENISYSGNTDYRSLEYVVLGKIVDRENLSTAMRASTVINDFKVFFDFPISGVGGGNQGYFYAENQPSWTLASEEVSDLIATNTIPNGGGNFFPAYISAYGIIGIMVLFAFISKYLKLYRSSFLMEDKRANTIYQTAIILFLFAAWHVVGIKQCETIVFILSLPCINYTHKKVLQ